MVESLSELSFELLQQLQSAINDLNNHEPSVNQQNQLNKVYKGYCKLNSDIRNLNCGEEIPVIIELKLNQANQKQFPEEKAEFYPSYVSDEKQLKPEEVGLDQHEKLKKLGSGSFGSVYRSEFKGVDVAVKVSQKEENEEGDGEEVLSQKTMSFEEEIKKLRSLRHDNIVGYRGSGVWNNKLFIVMEYIQETLLGFINSYSSHDGSGLSAYLTWHISRQVANAMNYLHSQQIVHVDLKPDNILLDTNPVKPKAKLCDFGLSCHSYEFAEIQGRKLGHQRYQAPELANSKDQPQTFEEGKKVDVFAYGLVVLVTRTGKRPWGDVLTRSLSSAHIHTVMQEGSKRLKVADVTVSDEDVGGHIGSLLRECCAVVDKRPGFDEIVGKHFRMENPFRLDESKGEFFSCGFLKNTNIFVADSVVAEVDVDQCISNPLPSYKHEDLICEVNTASDVNVDYLPLDQEEWEKYRTNLLKYNDLADAKKIDNNATIALKKIVTDRAGDDEAQKLKLEFVQSKYCHHRAMRDVWRSFDEVQKTSLVKCKSEVHDIYSTSFGLHIAIVTREKDGSRKFVFTKRSTKEGVASPGTYTCGAVESCSVKDYVENENGKAKVSLVKTAARGLLEELGLELLGEDLKAIHLNTLYLKFDNHEWGMCGFVDLNDSRVRKENQFSFEQLNAAFTSGPKDKFEHNSIEGVNFELSAMVTWLRQHHLQLASSAKIAVVKVLQAFFGTPKVTSEFEKYMQTDERAQPSCESGKQ